MADPRFLVGGGANTFGGSANARCVHFLTSRFGKIKEVGPIEGVHSDDTPAWIRR